MVNLLQHTSTNCNTLQRINCISEKSALKPFYSVNLADFSDMRLIRCSVLQCVALNWLYKITVKPTFLRKVGSTVISYKKWKRIQLASIAASWLAAMLLHSHMSARNFFCMEFFLYGISTQFPYKLLRVMKLHDSQQFSKFVGILKKITMTHRDSHDLYKFLTSHEARRNSRKFV